MAEPFEEAKAELNLSPEEVDSGEYLPENVEFLLTAARDATRDRPTTGAYLEALVDQNPEFMDLLEWTQTSVEDLLSLSLLLREFLSNTVRSLLPSASQAK